MRLDSSRQSYAMKTQLWQQLLTHDHKPTVCHVGFCTPATLDLQYIHMPLLGISVMA